MENYGRIDPKTGIHSRLLDFEKALNACIDHAIAQEVDFFLFAGDAYKTANPSPTQQRLLLKCFLRLYTAKIPVVIVVGNHDHPLSFGKATSLDVFSALPIDGFHVISKPTTLMLETKNGPIQIVGIPWPTRNTISLGDAHLFKSTSQITEYISKAVNAIIQDLAQKLNPEIPAVLAAHLTVSNGIFSGSEKRAIYGTDPLFMPSNLARQEFDYVALGHLHRYQNLNQNGYPALVYSGSLERIDFGERKEEKGFCLVTIQKRGETSHEFIRVDTRPFIQVEVELKADRDHTEQVVEAIEKYDVKDAVVKVVYHVPAGKKDLVRLHDVQRACGNAMHVVGIIPVHKPVAREKRIGLNVNMDLPTLLGSYFDSKPELKDRKEDLIKKAMLLVEEQQTHDTEGA
jgi:exonuclease SbcD